MIEIVVQIVMSTILICGALGIGVSLLKMHRAKDQPTLSDLITATDKRGTVRLDARKCFEAGAFLTSTWVLVYITSANKFSYEAFGLYLATWTAARWLRDREKRMAGLPEAAK